jgi:hypothetical protein
VKNQKILSKTFPTILFFPGFDFTAANKKFAKKCDAIIHTKLVALFDGMEWTDGKI